jgi:hypothetical protein
MNSKPSHNTGDILIYQNEKGDTKVDVYFDGDDLWMTQRAIAELYQVRIPTVNYHIKNIITDGELDESTIRDYLIVQREGPAKRERRIKHYDFKMILAIGYRVRSNVGAHFRNWASRVLTEYTKKGFVLNDERLRDPKPFGADYFDELLERIRDIRVSEKRLYRKITDIYALSCDYDKNSEQAQQFFATVQNKLHYSVTGRTAAELIDSRADARKPNMGLTAFKGAKVRRGDVTIAKNYLKEDEIKELNRIVGMYLDYAEDQANRHIRMYMSDWEQKLNAFLRFNEREILENKGTISMELAREHAEAQYDLYDDHRNIIEGSDDIDTIVIKTKKIMLEKKQ